MLAAHQEGDHHVGNFVIGEGCAVFVGGVHQVPDHVFAVFAHLACPPRIDDVGVDLRHLALSNVSASILWQRHPR